MGNVYTKRYIRRYMFKIVEKKLLAENIYRLRVEAPRVAHSALPGQFVIVRTDEHGERVPLTIADYDPSAGTVTIVIQAIGMSTRKMCALNEGDALAWTRLTSGHDMLIVATRNGQAIRFNEEDARPMGRSGHGVRAIKLAEGDEVVGVCICREGATILTVTENGKGRRSEIDTYRITARGGKGIRNYDASKDKVAAVKIVDDVDDILLSSQEGIIIRLHADSIPVQSRYGSGVRVMRLGENDKVMVLARTDHDDEAQTETVEAEEGDEPTAEQLAAMEAADEASAAEAPEADSSED